MATFATIKAGVKAIVEAEDNFDDGSVYEYEPPISGIEQDPFAVVLASENESDFLDTTRNKRVYEILVRVYVERNSKAEEAAETLLVTIVDSLINSFDNDITLGVADVLFSEATPSAWGYVESDKIYRTADIRLRVHVCYDTS